MKENPYNQIFSACQEAMVEHLDLEVEVKELKRQLGLAKAECEMKQQQLGLVSHVIVEAVRAGKIDVELGRILQKMAGFEVNPV